MLDEAPAGFVDRTLMKDRVVSVARDLLAVLDSTPPTEGVVLSARASGLASVLWRDPARREAALDLAVLEYGLRHSDETDVEGYPDA